MNEFTYHNIFETKGFEYIITIIFFALLIPFWLLIKRKPRLKEQVETAKGILKAAMMHVPGGIFVNRNHTWTFLERTGIAKVGMDIMLLKIVGNIQVEYLLKSGDSVKKGDLIAKIYSDKKYLEIHSPISGLVRNNNSLVNQPENIPVNDPYGSGWLLEIEPNNWIEETRNIRLGVEAFDWLKAELVRFKEFLVFNMHEQYENELGAVMQDGGELREYSLSDMPEQVWQEFQNEFLNKTE
ncbi:glycine cleavage system protein H [Saccharicrinis sp. FJH2]|uniref:glycine cleavage system protein H n=1 Tax=Saccharicrinis sp. FJH65 TaxID=3344659 RepID=UPI0035F21FC4